MRRVLIATLLIGFVCFAPSARPAVDGIAYEDPFTGFMFPQHLGSFSFQRHTRFERVQLGYGVSYVERTGATATISIYDMSLSGIETGTADPRLQDEYEKMDQAILAAARHTGYRGASRADGVQLSKAWLQINHELLRADGRIERSYSFIRGQNGRFVKIRVTTSAEATYARLPVFLLGVSRAIGMMA
jgi:hypothetical protein